MEHYRQTDYWERREQISALVRERVFAVVSPECLRGSWAFGDFHLSQTDGGSFSDVDLAAEEHNSEIEQKRQTISQDLVQAGFPLRVSAHRDKELSCVTFEDARILKIGEYLSKIQGRPQDQSYLSYWRAKTVLLLLRSTLDESYEAVAKRVGSADASDALAVKLGAQSFFSADKAKRLIESTGEKVSLEFFRRCILTEPDWTYREQIARVTQQCESFTPWLRNYILQKMNSNK